MNLFAAAFRFFLPLAVILAGTVTLPVFAAETVDLWSDDSEERIDTLELTKEKIDLILEAIEKQTPDQARQLHQWRKEDPFRFVVEIRRIAWAQRQLPQNRTATRTPKIPATESPAAPTESDNPVRWRETLEQRMEEFLVWFKIHNPVQEKALQELRKDDYEEFLNRVSSYRRRYEPIMRAEKRNPDLADALQKDIELQDMCSDLLGKIAVAKDKDRNGLIEQLQKTVADQFDVIVRKRALKYDEIESKINQMQQEVRQQKRQLEQLVEKKDATTKERVQELLSSIERTKKP